jgi:hypothetical protein
MKKTFKLEFDEEGANTLTYECLAEDERLSTTIENGVPTIYANRSGLITIAKILIKVALGSYANGFHLHIQQNFNEDLPDCLTIMLDSSESGPR